MSVTAASMGEKTAGARGEMTSDQYLTFRLSGESYGLPILQVREIIGLMQITKVPRTPEFVRGVINLRGKVIPVVDLRRKFEMEAADDTKQTCVIVVEVHQGETTLPMGVIVDEVSEVVDVAADQVDPTPPLGHDVETDFILGIGKVEGKVVMLLDINEVLSANELHLVEQAAG